MALDLILRDARIGGGEAATVDVAIAGGRIVDIASGIAADAPAENIGGRLVVAGFVETHIHLDKSCILDRCKSQQGTLQEAIAEVAAAGAVAEIVRPLFGMKNGRRTFVCPPARLLRKE